MVLSVTGCVHLTRIMPDGSRVSAWATGNASVDLDVTASRATVRARALDSAETYRALGQTAGQIAGAAARAAVAP